MTMSMPTTTMPMPTMTPQPSPLPKQPEVPLTPITPAQSTESVQIEPCNLAASDRSFPNLPTTTTTPHPPQPPHQPDLLHTHPTPSPTLQNETENRQPYNPAMQPQTAPQQHHMKLPMTMPPTLTPPMIGTNTLLITNAIMHHHKTLAHLEANFQQLSQSMAKVQAVIDCINHLLQPTTMNRLIANPTCNPTSPSLSPSFPKTTYPQPPMLACICCKPHPSPCFLTLLCRYHAHNYRPP